LKTPFAGDAKQSLPEPRSSVETVVVVRDFLFITTTAVSRSAAQIPTNVPLTDSGEYVERLASSAVY